MSSSSFRWRTIVELSVVSIIIYVFLGSPGLPSSSTRVADGSEHVSLSREKSESLVYPSQNLKCAPHEFDTHILSTSPLVIYIDGFLSESEADHLVDISADKWQVSTIFNGGVETTDDSIRKSEKSLIDRDHTVQCIEQRAHSVQGWPQNTFIERLWTQRYNVSGHYGLHYDWGTWTKSSRRESTFMVYLSANCKGGGTNFPKLKMPFDNRWCRFLECDQGDDAPEGVTFKARKGAAVFWLNFNPDSGRGYPETIHRAMPVTSGTKVGLNIWSWYQEGHTAAD